MRTRIKICGITNLEDAKVAVAAGADALGFMFYAKSPRCISPKDAALIMEKLPPFITKVGVFVDESRDEVKRIAESCGLDAVQFHGRETPDFCQDFGALKVYKAFRMKDSGNLEILPRFRTSAWLLDSYVPGQEGGTGERFNWELAVEAKRMGTPIILAGGLTPGNVGEAIRTVSPFGLDVSSGVESAPGRKDASKIRSFIEAAQRADLSLV